MLSQDNWFSLLGETKTKDYYLTNLSCLFIFISIHEEQNFIFDRQWPKMEKKNLHVKGYDSYYYDIFILNLSSF